MSDQRESQPADVRAGLRELRIRWHLFWFVSVGLLLVFGIFAAWIAVAGRWAKQWPDCVRGLVFSSLVVNVAWARVLLARCPRCGRRFYPLSRLPVGRLSRDRCASCDLPFDASA